MTVNKLSKVIIIAFFLSLSSDIVLSNTNDDSVDLRYEGECYKTTECPSEIPSAQPTVIPPCVINVSKRDF